MLDTRVVNGGVWGEPRLHELKHTGNEQSCFSRQQTAEKKIAVSSSQVPVFGLMAEELNATTLVGTRKWKLTARTRWLASSGCISMQWKL